MTKKDKATLVEGLKRICADVALLASLFEDEEAWAGGPEGTGQAGPGGPVGTEEAGPVGPRGRGKPAHLLDGPVCPVPDGPSDAQLRDCPNPSTPDTCSVTKVYTYEEVRAILAEKSRSGFRSEVKSILTAHGISQLSDVKDPNIFAAIVAEAEAIRID